MDLHRQFVMGEEAKTCEPPAVLEGTTRCPRKTVRGPSWGLDWEGRATYTPQQLCSLETMSLFI